jgi:hypothetical protein
VAIASTLFALLAGTSPAARAEEIIRTLSPVEGSWIFTVSAINGSYSFTALASFAAGGVWLATGSNDRVIPVSVLFGSWKRKGPKRFNATANFFAFDATGAAVAMNRVVQSYELRSRDEMVGVGEFSICEVSGDNCKRAPQIDFTVTAKRIIPEHLTELTLPPE